MQPTLCDLFDGNLKSACMCNSVSILQDQLTASQEAASKILVDAAELSSLRQENDASRELLQLDRDLFAEYDALVSESDSQLTANEKMIHELALELQRTQEERQVQEEELKSCKRRVGCELP